MRSERGTIVIALGGNALSPPGERVSIHEQFRHTRSSLDVVVALVRDGWKVSLVHGNGPQVGQALTRNEMARDVVEPLPLGVLVASTAGWIGYMIQQSLQNALRDAAIDREVLTLITQTEVDRDDPRLRVPTKPIGNVLDPERAARLRAEGIPLGTDAKGRVRRVTASPAPIRVVEADSVRRLVAEGKIVVAAGGGGPPVYSRSGVGWEGLDAVVDKDLVAAVLGRAIRADTLLILTDVDGVYRNWGTDAAVRLSTLTPMAAREMIASGQVGVGSMAPKLAAAVSFVEGGGERAVIAHLEHGEEALRRETGTTIEGRIE